MTLKDQIMVLQHRMIKKLTELSLNSLAIKAAMREHRYPATLLVRQDALIDDIIDHQRAVELLKDRVDGLPPMNEIDISRTCADCRHLLYASDPVEGDEDPEAPLWSLDRKSFRLPGRAA